MIIKKIPLLIKIIIIHILFILLHYLYDWFPNGFTAIFSGINESVYQHMKIGYFAYIIFALAEFLITRESIKSFDQYLYSRLFSASFLPLVILVIYLCGPLMFGHLESVTSEVFFANTALLASSFTTLIVERHIESTKPSILFRSVITALFALSLAQFIVFTKQVPWYDVFAIPPGY